MNTSQSAQLQLRRKPTEKEIEKICEAAESAARKNLFSKINPKQILDFEIAIEAAGEKPLTLEIDFYISNHQIPELHRLIDESSDFAFKAAEDKAKELRLV